MQKRQSFIKYAFAVCALTTATTALAGQVAVSNYPLFLLSQAVTQGVHDAQMILPVGDVGHHGAPAPSKMKLMHDATYVVWFGDALESNLAKSLNNAPNAISLFDMKAFHRLPMRTVDGAPIKNSFDVHIWLDPINAKAIVAALTVVHSHANPDSKDVFQKNANLFYQKMDALMTEPSPEASYWAYHDSYQYLEKSLNLRFAGALSPDHHLAPKASRFKTLQDNRPSKTMCLAAQSEISDGIQARLSPIRALIRQEDMSDKDSFLAAWSDLKAGFDACVAR